MIKFYAFILALLCFFGCSDDKEAGPITSLQRQVFSYLPDDTRYLVFMNIDELKKTVLWENYFKISILGKNNYGKSFNTFEEETGVSLDFGISKIFSASTKQNKNFFVVIFDKNLEKIKKYFNENFFSENLKNKMIYKTNENSKGLFYFVNDSTLMILRSEPYLKDLINGKNKSLLTNKNLLKTIKGITNKNQYWVVDVKGNYLINLFEKKFGISKNFSGSELLESVEELTLSASFNNFQSNSSKKIEIESLWNCKNSKDAYLLSTAMKGVIAMDLISKSNYALGKILEKTEIKTENNFIEFHLKINNDNLNELKKITREKYMQKIL